MPNSFATTAQLTCTACRRNFQADVWLIVDSAERPDLLEQASEGLIHALTCPHCGQANTFTLPLLLYRPELLTRGLSDTPLIFMPGSDSDATQQAGELIIMLRSRLGEQWSESWLQNAPGLTFDLPFSVDRQAATPSPAPKTDAMPQHEPLPLMRLIIDFVSADTWAASQRIVETNPDLLSDEVDALLSQLIDTQSDDQSRQVLADHRTLLNRCREIDVSTAFAEKTYQSLEVGMPDLPEDVSNNMRPILEMLANLPEEQRNTMLQIFADANSLEELFAALAQQPKLHAAMASALASSPNRPTVPTQFAADLTAAQEAEALYMSSARPEALNAAADAWNRILDNPDLQTGEPSFRLMIWNNAGGILLRRYWATGQIDDLNRALELWQAAVSETAAGSPDRPIYLNNLGSGLRARFAHIGQVEDLEEAIRVYEAAVTEMSAASPDRPGYLNNLGTGLSERFERNGQIEDLEAAIRVYEIAVAETPPDSQDRPIYRNNLGIGLRARFAYSGRSEDLEEAIRMFKTAVAETSMGSPQRPKYLSNWGIGLRARFAHSGRLEDLEEAIRVFDVAVAETPAGSPDRPSRLNNLGNGLRSRFTRSGRLEDLEAAIQMYKAAVAETPAGSPDRPSRLNNLGTGLSSRFAHSGRLEDLEEAIRVFDVAVAETPTGSPDRPSRLNNLGNGLRSRFALSGRSEDLEEAIRVFEAAVAETPAGSPDRPSRLNNWGTGLSVRFAYNGRSEDLEEAIRVFEASVAETPAGSPARPIFLNNLGTGLRDRSMQSGRVDDLEEAIRVFEAAAETTPVDSPERPLILSNLGTGLSDRFARSGRIEDLEKANNAYRTACELGSVTAPEEALRAGRNWGRWASTRPAPNFAEASVAYTYALDAIDTLFSAQFARSSQESWLKEAQGLHTAAAYALVRQARPAGFSATRRVFSPTDPAFPLLCQAIETIERGQARFLAQALEENRADLARLADTGHGDLHAAYQENLSHRAGLLTQLEQATDDTARSAVNTALRTNQDERNALIERIRSIPGFEEFLARPSFDRITERLGEHATAVYLMATAVGGLALLLRTGASAQSTTITTVWLDALNEEWLHQLLQTRENGEITGGYLLAYIAHQMDRTDTTRQAWFTVLDNTCRALWDQVMGPLAQALTYLPTDPQSPNPSIPQSPISFTLIPTGLLTLLPLHAAWTETPTSRRYFLDDFTVNYAASVTALGHSRQRAAAASDERLLAVANPQPVDAPPLTNARLQVEVIANLFVPTPILAENDATYSTILAALPYSDVFNFSGHGNTAWGNPMESTLWCAYDKRLTVRDLLALRLPAKRLAVLSACETGIPGRQLPDETVNLPTALVQAGFAGVVASLWSVYEISTALLLVRFYHHWRVDNLDPVPALRAAQIWLRDTTNAEKAAFFDDLVPELQPSMAQAALAKFANLLDDLPPDDRFFAHPIHWAAFTLTGV